MNSKKIIISNIGNRNVSYLGQLYNDIYPSNEAKKITSFRDFCYQFLDSNSNGGFKIKEEVRTHLKLNIIQNLIEKYRDKTKLIVLCSSDQAPAHSQDTVYEAWIMKELIEDEYKIPVQIRPIECSVVDLNELMKRYRQIVNWIKRNYSDHYIHICDAGGTPQQKSALKIVTEFILDPEYSKVEYVYPNNKIEEMPPLEYRYIIASMQADVLVKQGEYDAALSLFNTTPAAAANECGSGLFKKLIALGSYVLKNNYCRASSIAAGFKKNVKQKYPFISRYESGIAQGDIERFNEVVTGKNFFKVCEKLSQAQYFYQISNYSKSILTYAIFYELYLNTALSHIFQEDLLDPYYYNENLGKIETKALRLYPDLKQKYTPVRRSGIPFKIDVLSKQTKYEYHSQFIDLLKQHISGFPNEESGSLGPNRSLNSVRNQIAHSGKEIDKGMIKNELKYFKELLHKSAETFGLPNQNFYKNLYLAVQNEMTK